MKGSPPTDNRPIRSLLSPRLANQRLLRQRGGPGRRNWQSRFKIADQSCQISSVIATLDDFPQRAADQALVGDPEIVKGAHRHRRIGGGGHQPVRLRPGTARAVGLLQRRQPVDRRGVKHRRAPLRSTDPPVRWGTARRAGNAGRAPSGRGHHRPAARGQNGGRTARLRHRERR